MVCSIYTIVAFVEGDFRYDVILSKWRPRRHFTLPTSVNNLPTSMQHYAYTAASAAGIARQASVKKERTAVTGTPSHSYGTSLAIWDHTVLPATRHK